MPVSASPDIHQDDLADAVIRSLLSPFERMSPFSVFPSEGVCRRPCRGNNCRASDGARLFLVGTRSRLQRSDDLIRGTGETETREDFFDSELVMFGSHCRHAVLSEHDAIVVLVCIATGPLNAKIGRDAGEDDRVDPAPAKLKVELGAVKGAPVSLGYDDFGG